MSIQKILDQSYVPSDLAESLGPNGIKLILEIVWDAYHELRNVKGFTANESVHENKITEEWGAIFTKKWYQHDRAINMNIIPVNQHEDETMSSSKGFRPTIDFCLRESYPDNRYFGIECKKLVEKDKAKLKYYIYQGIERYVDGKYGTTCSEDAIMGYVVGGSISNVIEEVKGAMSDYRMCLSPMTREMQFAEPTFSCVCKRKTVTKNIKIDQLFLDFV